MLFAKLIQRQEIATSADFSRQNDVSGLSQLPRLSNDDLDMTKAFKNNFYNIFQFLTVFTLTQMIIMNIYQLSAIIKFPKKVVLMRRNNLFKDIKSNPVM